MATAETLKSSPFGFLCMDPPALSLRVVPAVLCTGIVGLKFAAFFLATAAFAQQWEVGGSLGYGWYRKFRVNGPGAEASAGIQNRFTAGVVVSEDLYEHISGDLRYTYQDGDPFIELGGRRANIQGQSHSFTYDTLFHVRNRDYRLRPFFAAGAGAKYFRSTGPEPSQQPAPAQASLVHANQWRLVVSVGAGVTYRFPNHIVVRADFRDYISPVPRRIFSPAPGATARGLMHQFTPMFGVGYWF
jgi:hypothetical protein